MRYFSTFSGIGGFELGINQAYEHYLSLRNRKTMEQHDTQTESMFCLEAPQSGPQHQRGISNPASQSKPVLDIRRPHCVGYSEINPSAIAIYHKQFPSHKNYGDITTINLGELPNFDFLVGGFPCQSFSVAGKRKGFNDTRGTLFFEIARIVRQKQPSFLLLENVKGLLSHDKGRTFTIILTTLSELGYDCEWQVINSKAYVPQNRERIFIIGHLRGKDRPKVFPLLPPKTIYSRPHSSQEKVYASTLTARQFASWYGNFVRENQNQIRRLTPVECERLQGFPDHWTAEGIRNGQIVNISDTQRYKVLGNAVTVPVIRSIVLAFLESAIYA